MRCRSIKVRMGEAEDGRSIVVITLGNMRDVGCHDEVAWCEMPPGMADSIASDLRVAAADARRLRKAKTD